MDTIALAHGALLPTKHTHQQQPPSLLAVDRCLGLSDSYRGGFDGHLAAEPRE